MTEFEKAALERLDAIIAELRAIHILLEGPAPDAEPIDRDALIASVTTAADLRRMGLWKRN